MSFGVSHVDLPRTVLCVCVCVGGGGEEGRKRREAI
jgi:hypothetical protein